MERKIIDTGLQAMLQGDEIGTVRMLYSVLREIYMEYGDITDNHIKKYNASENAKYKFNVTISTIRNYLKPYNYVVQKNSDVIVREMTIEEYFDTLGSDNEKKTENNGNDFMENLTVKQKISLAYADKSEQYNDVKLLSLRCSKDVLERFNELAKKFKCFEKSYLLSFILESGMDSVGYKTENI